MKINVTLLFFSCLWLVVRSDLSLSAQNESINRGLDRYFSDLSSYLVLTEEQKEKMQDIIEANQKKQRQLYKQYRENYREQDSSDMALLRKKMQENHKSLLEELAKVLSAKQMEDYEKFHDELRKRRRERIEPK